MKETICTIAGVVCSFIAGLFGGWDASMVTLLLFMGVDYITGLAVAACGKSPKSDTGRLSSKIGWCGLAKKCVSLLLVLIPEVRFLQIKGGVTKWNGQKLSPQASPQ